MGGRLNPLGLFCGGWWLSLPELRLGWALFFSFELVVLIFPFWTVCKLSFGKEGFKNCNSEFFEFVGIFSPFPGHLLCFSFWFVIFLNIDNMSWKFSAFLVDFLAEISCAGIIEKLGPGTKSKVQVQV